MKKEALSYRHWSVFLVSCLLATWLQTAYHILQLMFLGHSPTTYEIIAYVACVLLDKIYLTNLVMNDSSIVYINKKYHLHLYVLYIDTQLYIIYFVYKHRNSSTPIGIYLHLQTWESDNYDIVNGEGQWTQHTNMEFSLGPSMIISTIILMIDNVLIL